MHFLLNLLVVFENTIYFDWLLIFWESRVYIWISLQYQSLCTYIKYMYPYSLTHCQMWAGVLFAYVHYSALTSSPHSVKEAALWPLPLDILLPKLSILLYIFKFHLHYALNI